MGNEKIKMILRPKSLITLMLAFWQLISCSNGNNGNLEPAKISDLGEYWTINTNEINFESIYRVHDKVVKDPLPIDTIYLKLKFKENFKKVVYANDVEVVPNINGCFIKKLSHHNYKIYFDDSFSGDQLIWTCYLKPSNGAVFDKNKKQSFTINDRVFIAEKHNNLSTTK